MKCLGHFQSVLGPKIACYFQGWSVFQKLGAPLIFGKASLYKSKLYTSSSSKSRGLITDAAPQF